MVKNENVHKTMEKFQVSKAEASHFRDEDNNKPGNRFSSLRRIRQIS